MIRKQKTPKGMLLVDGVPVVNPKHNGFGWDKSDIDDRSERNQEGTMIRNRIAKKRKLICNWGPLDAEELSELLVAVSPEYVTLTFPDAETGRYTTKRFYAGDKSAKAYCGDAKTGEIMWESFSMNFIEA